MLNKLGNDLYYFDQVVEGKKKQQRSNQNPLPTGFLVYTKHKFSTTRTFENVYFEEQPIVKKRVEFFLGNRSWYERKGIPYTLGFLFHGSPGTGKTSEIKAIANVARRHPVNIQLSEIKTKTFHNFLNIRGFKITYCPLTIGRALDNQSTFIGWQIKRLATHGAGGVGGARALPSIYTP